MNYLLIKNGFIVTGNQEQKADLLIFNNKIVEIKDIIQRPTPGTPVIDATGKYIFPGSIDINRSFLSLARESKGKEELHKLSQAEILSGTTTILDSFTEEDVPRGQMPQDAVILKNIDTQVNYAIHVSTLGWHSFTPKEMTDFYLYSGVSSFKTTQPAIIEKQNKPLANLMKTASAYGLLLIIEFARPFADKSGYVYQTDSPEEDAERHLSSLKQTLRLARKYKCKLLFSNISFEEELELINHARKKHNLDLYIELAFPFSINEKTDVSPTAQINMSGFSLTKELTIIHQDRLWELLKDNHILLGRPQYHFTPEEEEIETEIYNKPDKYFFLKNFLSVLYSAAIVEKKLTYSELVDIICTRPARIFGFYPSKGCIEQGSDADLVIWNPDYMRNLTFSFPFEKETEASTQFQLKGRTEFVFNKGRMVYNGETFLSNKLKGEYLYRGTTN